MSRPAPAGGRTGRRRRSVVDFSKSQTGDNQFHNAAGGNIYHGINPDDIVEFLKEYVFLDRQERHKRTTLKDEHDRNIMIALVVLVVLQGINIVVLLIVLERLGS